MSPSPPSPRPWQPPSYSLFLRLWFFLDSTYKWYTLFVFLWLIPLIIMSSRLIHVVTNGWIIFHCVSLHPIFFIHWQTHMLFHILTIVNNAPINVFELIFSFPHWTLFFISFNKMFKVAPINLSAAFAHACSSLFFKLPVILYAFLFLLHRYLWASSLCFAHLFFFLIHLTFTLQNNFILL